jgi:hypothetical protein
MKPFDYVMTLVSIVVGLAITHVLGALGAAVHRLRGNGPPIRLEPVFLLWMAFVLFYVVSFWWWEFQFNQLPMRWTYGLYLFLVTYAVLLYLVTVVLVPANLEGVEDSYAHFMGVRRWFLGLCLLSLFVDLGDSALKSVDHALDPFYLLQELLLGTACVVGLLSERRNVQLGVAIFALGYQLFYVWQAIGTIGGN